MDQKVVQKIGKYEIVAELGQGGMGVVYKARDPFIGRLVALKTITPELVSDPEILKRFYREAQSAGTLQHPNIVTIYDLGEADGRPYIAMEFVEGESLQNLINRGARIPLAAKLKLVQQCCEGLGHAHKHGFVHRDVKPANILVTNDGIVKVVDFGIVHLESTNLTKTGMFLGTIHYASPEQINDGRVDSRSDLWSVACVVYEFIAYKKAFDGSNIAAIIAKVLSAEPEPLSRCCPGVPVELDEVISKGLKKNVEERYQSLDEMLSALHPISLGLQRSFIGDLFQEAKDLRDKGEFNGAQDKVRAILMLDNTDVEAKRLNSEISHELQRLAPFAKAKRLVGEAEQAFSRGEYAEAARILGEAQLLNPADTQARNLKEKALREQDRVQELRESLSSGQRAMKQGDLTGAEQELHRALQIDQNNTQAVELLEQIRQDRLSRERDFRLKEALWEADNLVSAGKYEEAQNQLLELQQDFPSSDEIHVKLQALDPLVRSRKLVQDGEKAFNQAEYAEAVRALTEALELNPQDNEARDLKERALQERDRLRQVREALSSGQRAMRQGDASAAERELQRALQLDPTNAQATSLLGQIRQTQAAREREGQFRQALQQSDNLVAEGKFDDAQRTLLDLQQEFPDSTEIDQKLLALDEQMKLGRLLGESQKAFDQGEFGEAVRILNEAQELYPSDERVRDLKVRAVQERDRLRHVREAISAGQRAMRQGDTGAAEREYQRALQLDPANTQAKNLLAQIQKDRQGSEREQRLKEGLSQAEKLLSRKKFDEAQRKLTELQQAYPDAVEVQQKLQALSQRKAKPAAPAPPPAPSAPVETAPLGGAPLSDAAKSMQLAEELRRSLQTPRAAEPAPPRKPPAPEPAPTMPIAQAPPPMPLAPELTPTMPIAQAPPPMPSALEPAPTMPIAQVPPPMPPTPELTPTMPIAQAPPPMPPAPELTPTIPIAAVPEPPTPATEAPKAESVAGATLLLRTSLRVRAEAEQKALEAPPPPPPEVQAPPPTPAPPLVEPKKPAPPLVEPKKPAPPPVEPKKPAPPPVEPKKPAPPRVEPKKPAPAPAPPRVTPAPPVMARTEAPKKSPMIMVAAIALVVILAIGGYMIFHHPSPGGGGVPAEETQLETDAKGLQDKGDLQGALGKWQELAAKKGVLKGEANSAIAEVTQKIQQQEKTLFDQAKADQEAKKWDDAIAKYNKVADMNGTLKDQALAAIPVVKQQQQGMDVSKIEKQTFQAAANAFKKNDYSKARGLFQQVIDLKVPDSSLVPQAQTQLASIDQILQAKAEFDAAAGAQNRGDLQGALKQFQAIALKPGNYQAEAKARIPKLNVMINDAGAKQEYNAALQTESSGNFQSALDQFKAIVGKGGPFKGDAQAQIQKINDQLGAQAAQQQFDAAVKAQNSGDLNGALSQFKALASKPGPKQSDAQQRVQSITDQITQQQAQQQAQQQFNAADQTQKNGDLKGALAQFKVLADKPGPKQVEAQAREQQVAQLIAAANKPVAPPTPTPAPPTPAPPTTPTPTPTAAHNPVVTPLYSGDLRPLTLPYHKGMTVADVNVDGGLKAANLAMAPVQGAPAGSLVMIMIKIDENGSVTPDRVINDTSGFGPQVQEAARAWKFNPPTAKGKPVNTALTVKVTF